MTIRKKRKPSHREKTVIDLTGPEGNAFYLMGLVQNIYRRSGAWELGQEIVKEMKSSDYEHLLKTFDLYLGDHYILER
jgi:hypothetical protein